MRDWGKGGCNYSYKKHKARTKYCQDEMSESRHQEGEVANYRCTRVHLNSINPMENIEQDLPNMSRASLPRLTNRLIRLRGIHNDNGVCCVVLLFDYSTEDLVRLTPSPR